jgi:hypothetical protein
MGLLDKFFRNGDSPRHNRTPNNASLISKRSGWTVRNGNELVMEYHFTGALPNGVENMVQLEVTFMPFAILGLSHVAVQRFVNIFLHPDMGYPDCYLLAIFDILAGSESTGFIPVRVTPAAGGSTLVNIPDRDAADRLCGLLSLGRELSFALWNKQEPILKLPLYNDASYHVLSRKLTDELRSGCNE